MHLHAAIEMACAPAVTPARWRESRMLSPSIKGSRVMRSRCFQNSFVNAEPYACDCDTSTGPLVWDLFDFLCFRDEFVSGCP